MDALVVAALHKVQVTVAAIEYAGSATDRQSKVVKAINAVDALKSALKTV